MEERREIEKQRNKTNFRQTILSNKVKQTIRSPEEWRDFVYETTTTIFYPNKKKTFSLTNQVDFYIQKHIYLLSTQWFVMMKVNGKAMKYTHSVSCSVYIDMYRNAI